MIKYFTIEDLLKHYLQKKFHILVNEKDISGWFIGYVETTDTTYFFATNIRANTNATGSHAAEITFDIFKNLNIIT